MRNILCIALALLLTACAQNAPIRLYEGAERNPAQLLVVRVPADLEVETINGSKAPGLGGLGRDDFQTLHLQPGDYEIAAFYKGVFDVMGVNTEVVRSRIAVFTVSGQAGEVWTLDFKRPANLEEARRMRQRFDAWAANTATGQRIEARQGGSPNTITTQLLGSASAAPTAVKPAATSIQPQNAPPASVPHNAPAASLPHNDATLTTLKQLWELLTPESRQAFLEWQSKQ